MLYTTSGPYKILTPDDLSTFKNDDYLNLLVCTNLADPLALKLYNLILCMEVYKYYKNVISFRTFHALTNGDHYDFRSTALKLMRATVKSKYYPGKGRQPIFSRFYVYYHLISYELSTDSIETIEFNLRKEKLQKCPLYFGNNLKCLRMRRHLSQADLATKAKITRNYVSKMEKESSYPSFTTLLNLCDALDCTIDDLLYKIYVN